MIKKLAGKLKSLFGKKTKTQEAAVNISVTQVKELKQHHRQSKTQSGEKSFGAANKSKTRRKETPEEYRLRHQQRKQNKSDSPKPEKKPHSELQRKLQKPKTPHIWDESVFNVPAEEGRLRFHDLNVGNEILHAVFDLGFQYCTPVQAETLPKSLQGEDITAQAQTGTGKTAAFLITILNRINKIPVEKNRKPGMPRALILAPTRELVLQIEKDARGLGKFLHVFILSLLGGIDYKKQQDALRKEQIDILICTPGRLLDFIQKRFVDLRATEILVIDEADRMLDMGFIPSVKKIILHLPQKDKRQTMFFSATVTSDVKRLAESWTRNAVEVSVKPEEVAVQSVEQITYITSIEEKPTLLYNLIKKKNLERVLVFVNRRDDAKKLKETFEVYGISTTLLSGDVQQTQRINRLEKFRDGKIRVLVATDVASRGIHVEGISHVINYNLPQDVEEYVHRIGRTGRAGASGISISFADENDSHEIPKLEEYLGKKIECKFPEEELLIPIPKEHRAVEHKEGKTYRKPAPRRNYRRPPRKK